ncbi:MAG: hypothetical protein QG641_785, partial [Candidatus Poribacteria bacterium]|nr:hypothetical protein [Candidatus Poribacteria bacterium]
IMISPNASPIETFATQELQGYIMQVSGAFPPIAGPDEPPLGKRIYIGKGILAKMGLNIDESTLGSDGFVIKTDGDKIFIAGNTPGGTLYGIYAFIESIGCRWFAPGVNGEIIPQIPSITIPQLNISERPRMSYRGFKSSFLTTYTNTEWIDWMAKNRLNLLMIDDTMYNDLKNTVRGELERRVIQVGVSFEIPESEDEDKTKDDVSLETFTKKLMDFINSNPEVSIIERRLKTSNKSEINSIKQESLINIANTIHENHPKKSILPLLGGTRIVSIQVDYSSVKTSGKIFYSSVTRRNENGKGDYVFSFEPTERCYRHSLGDRECKINGKQRTCIETLQKLGTKISLYEHYMASYEQNSLPFPILQTISSDFKYLSNIGGFNGAISQCESSNFGTYGLNYYVFARMSWNPQYDLGMIVDDYCNRYYDKSSEPMKRFFSILEDAMAKMEHFSYIDPPELIIKIFDEATLKELQNQLDMAKSLTNDVIVFDRIRKSQLSLDYTTLLWNTIYYYLKGIEFQEAKNKDAKDYLQKAYENGDKLVKFLYRNLEENVFIVTESFVFDYLEPIISDARGRLDSLGS